MQTQQSTRGQYISRLKQHQPITGQLPYYLVEVGNHVAGSDLDKMQGIPWRGNRRQLTGLEHDNLEVPQPTGQQAVERALQRSIIVIEIHQHESDLRQAIFAQVSEHTFSGGIVRRCCANGCKSPA
ncbi:hypothetical protein D3C81_1931530 [compost metagenome]